ncbi:MAG: FeoB-associated Cys-rich membrane protein [Clostridia bacterium]|nr:FeoB-associated Cys-rich membrane protein [Clostridia bacterium]
MIDVLVIAILLIITGLIIFYLVRAKKRGETCIGCPHAKECAKKHCNSSKRK